MDFLSLDAETTAMLMTGLRNTLLVCSISLVIGIAIGLAACFGKMLDKGLFSVIAKAYIDLFRTLPEIVTIFWIYACFPLVFGLRLSSFETGVLALSLYSGAFLAEIFRAGVQSIPRGQFEAARALAIPQVWIWITIILPQMVRLMIPAFVAFLTDLLKVSGLLSAIGVAELVYQASIISARNFQYFEMFTAIGLMYFAMIFPLSMLAQHSGRRLARRQQ